MVRLPVGSSRIWRCKPRGYFPWASVSTRGCILSERELLNAEAFGAKDIPSIDSRAIARTEIHNQFLKILVRWKEYCFIEKDVEMRQDWE